MLADAPPKRRGGRPRSTPDALRATTIGVRVSSSEYAALRLKSQAMAMSPAQWLREAALTRRLPTPPVPTINVEQYAELGRLAGNLNQLTKLAHQGQSVTVADALLERIGSEVRRLRLTLIAADTGAEDFGETASTVREVAPGT